MTTERILVMVLNMRSPIPNAAAIKSHLPSTVVLLKVNPSDAAVRDYLEESEERLVAWANGTLPEVYGFDSDLNLEHAPAPPSVCLLYTSPSPRDKRQSRMPSSA